MIDLEQEVQMSWNGNNKKYYESKGYIYTKQYDKFLIKVKDLHPKSGKRVLITCDYCGKIYESNYDLYNSYKIKSIINKDACISCGHEKLKDSNIVKYGHKHYHTKDIMFTEVFDQFNKRGYILIGTSEFPIHSRTTLYYICKKHNNFIQKKFYYKFKKGEGCIECSRDKHRGANNNTWNGGITSLNTYLRNQIIQWRDDSFKQYNYKCFITGVRSDLIIHHLYSFSKIVQESLIELNIDLRDSIIKYSEEELKQISKKCLELHYKYGLGVCLNKDVHKIYHKIKKFKNSTFEQFEEFKQRYLAGEFNDQLNSV